MFDNSAASLETTLTDSTRRTLLLSSAAMAAAFGTSKMAVATEATQAAQGAFLYQHEPVPLPYKPGAIKGLSEKLIQSHWENNYIGSVKALNVVRSRLQQAMADPATPAYVYNGLKREQLLRTSSVVLHELYFANLGGDGAAGASLRSSIAGSFGSFDVWESEFRKMAQGLGGGSGWVVLGYNTQLGLLENYWMADHATGPVGTLPVLVLDMYEHSYQMDYGAAVAKYIDAFFGAIRWETVAQRLGKVAERYRS